MDIFQWYELSRSRSGVAKLTNRAGKTMYINISTRTGNGVIIYTGVQSNIPVTPDKYKDYTTDRVGASTVIVPVTVGVSGNLLIRYDKGLSDIYSIWIGYINKGISGNEDKDQMAYVPIQTFLSQFPNLYSVYVNEKAGGIDSSQTAMYGDFALMPNSIEKVLIDSLDVRSTNAGGEIVVNISNFSNSSNLKSFVKTDSNTTLKILGDLAKLPISCNIFKIVNNSSIGSAITYTAGKVWASAFETLSIPSRLTTSELDAMLIDMQNSVTSVGAGTYALDGLRSSVSDAAVAYLEGLGRTVNILRISDTVLKTPLAANLLDTSTYLNHATMVGIETHSLGGLVTSTGNYAYIPNKTSLDFGTGSLYFGCKIKFNTVPTSTKGIMGKSILSGAIGRYSLHINSAGNITSYSVFATGNNQNSTPASPYADGMWHSLECVCDRVTGKQMLYIDGILISTVGFTPSTTNVAVNARFGIGYHGDATGSGLLANSEFNGVIKDVFVHKF